jgi:hypothetical protein
VPPRRAARARSPANERAPSARCRAAGPYGAAVIGPVVPERPRRRPTAHEWAWIAAVPVSAAVFLACRGIPGLAEGAAAATVELGGMVAPKMGLAGAHVTVLTSCCVAPLGGALLLTYAVFRQLDPREALHTLPLFLGSAATVFLHDRGGGAIAGLWVTFAIALLAVGEGWLRRSRDLLVTASCLVGATLCAFAALFGLGIAGAC